MEKNIEDKITAGAKRPEKKIPKMISVHKSAYDALREKCAKQGISVSAWIESMIKSILGK